MAKDQRFEEMPDAKVITGIIEKYNISGPDRLALIHIKDTFYSGSDHPTLAEMDNETFKKVQNGFKENQKLREELKKFKEMTIIQFIKFKTKSHEKTIQHNLSR